MSAFRAFQSVSAENRRAAGGDRAESLALFRKHGMPAFVLLTARAYYPSQIKRCSSRFHDWIVSEIGRRFKTLLIFLLFLSIIYSVGFNTSILWVDFYYVAYDMVYLIRSSNIPYVIVVQVLILMLQI
jgi:hypothetical protein